MNIGMQYLTEHLLFIADLDPKHLHYVLYKKDGNDAFMHIYTIYPDSIRNGSAIYGKYTHISYINGTAYNHGSVTIDSMISARSGWSSLTHIGYQRLPNDVVEGIFQSDDTNKVAEWVMV